MRENLAKEKLRIVDIIKENTATVITIGGFIWLLYSTIIMPIKQLEFNVNDILNNHIKTIQDQNIIATQERKEQGDMIKQLNESIIRLQEIVKTLNDDK